MWLHKQTDSICGCSETLILLSKAFTHTLCLPLWFSAFTVPVSSVINGNRI